MNKLSIPRSARNFSLSAGMPASKRKAAELRAAGYQFGRVAVENREQYLLLTAGGERAAEVSGRFLFEAESPADFPKVGDWVAITDDPGGDRPSSTPSFRGGPGFRETSPEKGPKNRSWPPTST